MMRPRARHMTNVELATAFMRAAAVQRHLRMDGRECDSAAGALAGGVASMTGTQRVATVTRLHRIVHATVGRATEVTYRRGHTWWEARTVGMVVRAHILRTPLALATVTRVLQLGGWVVALAFPMLERAE